MMFAYQRICLLTLLSSVCFSSGELAETDNLEQKWTTVCENSEPIVTLENYNTLATELCDKRIVLAQEIEKRTALHERVDLLLAASKEQNELKEAHHEKEKIILQENSELRINLAMQNENVTLFKECSQKLDECVAEKSVQNKTSECSQVRPLFPRMARKENLIALATGHYHISAKTEKATWYKATWQCKFLGLELASIETKEEDDALIKVLDVGPTFWTSGTDQGSEGQFYWASTGHRFGDYQNFDIKQPDNAFAVGEHCLQYWRSRTGMNKWNDRGCDFVSRYICEYKSP